MMSWNLKPCFGMKTLWAALSSMEILNFRRLTWVVSQLSNLMRGGVALLNVIILNIDQVGDSCFLFISSGSREESVLIGNILSILIDRNGCRICAVYTLLRRHESNFLSLNSMRAIWSISYLSNSAILHWLSRFRLQNSAVTLDGKLDNNFWVCSRKKIRIPWREKHFRAQHSGKLLFYYSKLLSV